MNITNLIYNKWIDYYFKIEDQFLTDTHIYISQSLKILFNDIIKHTSDNTIILIQFKIKIDNNYRSISYLQSIINKDFNELLEIFLEYCNLIDEDYLSLNPSYIVYTYKIINKNYSSKDNYIKRRLNNPTFSNNSNLNFKGYHLPNTMDFTEWGIIINQTDSFAKVKKVNSNSNYYINIYDDHLKVNLKLNDRILLEFTDILIEKDKLNSFIRKIKHQEYIFIDGKLIVKQIHKNTEFLKKILPPSFINDHFLTMDLETNTTNGTMMPYCVSIYDGEKLFHFI